jgi:hypothetical protein
MQEPGYHSILKDNESLSVFLRCLKEFDQDFCNLIYSGTDFTLRLEVRGNQGRLIHCRLSRDRFDKPLFLGNGKIDDIVG